MAKTKKQDGSLKYSGKQEGKTTTFAELVKTRTDEMRANIRPGFMTKVSWMGEEATVYSKSIDELTSPIAHNKK